MPLLSQSFKRIETLERERFYSLRTRLHFTCDVTKDNTAHRLSIKPKKYGGVIEISAYEETN